MEASWPEEVYPTRLPGPRGGDGFCEVPAFHHVLETIPGPTVVALPKPGIPNQRQAAISKRDFRGPVRTLEIGAEDGRQILVCVSGPHLGGLGAAQRGEFRIVPSRGDPLLVVDGRGVRFEKKNGSSGRTRTYNPPVHSRVVTSPALTIYGLTETR